MNRPAPRGGGEAGGCLIAGLILVAVVAFVASKAGVDLGRFFPDASTATGDHDRGGSEGNVVFPEGVNNPHVPIDPRTMAFLQTVADIYGDTMVVSSGSGGAHGAVSDHYAGHAADFGMRTNGSEPGSSVGDRMMRACLIAAGDSEAKATELGRNGGLETRNHRGYRIQCIWKVDDHWDHVHIAARPTG